MDFQIHEIHFKDTLDIRHKVMWPNKNVAYVQLPNDEDGNHFGLFVNDNLISVISVFVTNNELQFRKFATLTTYQGKGFGSKLLAHTIHLLEKEKYQKIWCNARVDKVDLYCKFGLKETNTRFTKGGIDYVIMERNFT